MVNLSIEKIPKFALTSVSAKFSEYYYNVFIHKSSVFQVSVFLSMYSEYSVEIKHSFSTVSITTW